MQTPNRSPCKNGLQGRDVLGQQHLQPAAGAASAVLLEPRAKSLAKANDHGAARRRRLIGTGMCAVERRDSKVLALVPSSSTGVSAGEWLFWWWWWLAAVH